MDRRTFLMACLLPLSGVVEAGSPDYSKVWLRRGGDDFVVDLNTGRGYDYFRWFLRDVNTGQMGFPPLHLGYTLAWIQTFFRMYGLVQPIHITSGMRLKATNAAIEGAARSSLHIPDRRMVFRAVDIKIEGVSGEYLGRLAALARQGGVGFYGVKGHTHIDVGPIRYWRRTPRIL